MYNIVLRAFFKLADDRLFIVYEAKECSKSSL